jgi:dipeptidyl aminopeptidase/acylaminoacyl peptidase
MSSSPARIVAALCIACSVLSSSGAAELIPRRVLLADTDRTSVQLSPDGTRVGWLAPGPNGRRLFVRHVDGPAHEEEIAPGEAIVAWQFSGDGPVLLVTRDARGDVLSALSPGDRANARTLAFGSRVRVISAGQADVVASVRADKADSSGVFHIRLDVADRRKLADLGDADAWWVDGNPRIIAARVPSLLGYALAQPASNGAWTTFAEAGPLDGVPAGVVSVSRDGSHIFYVARDGRDTTALFDLDVGSGRTRVLAHDPDADVLAPGATVDARTGRPSSVVSYHVRLERHYLDEKLRPEFDALAKIRPGDVSIAGQSADDSRWLVRWLDGGPAHYAVWDRKSRRVIDLFDDVPGLAGRTLAPRHPLIVRSRDGLDLRSHLYLPPGSDANGDGIPDTPLPTVVFVHGGPWVGYDWNLWLMNRNFQLLANRGYAVIKAGFRGEPGYGMQYVDKGDRAWGTSMHEDLVDIAEHAVKRGIAARGKIAMWGWSYGGYAVATALARAPETFACGLAMYGVYDLESILRLPFFANSFWRTRVGDIDSKTDLDRLRDQSPLTHVDAIRKPLLVTHGALDDRVPIAQSDTLVAALQRRDRPVTYVVFPEEGHDYARPESWQAFWAIGEAFLHEHLGGSAEAMKDEDARARIEIRAGADRIAAWRKAVAPGGG